MGVTDLSLVSRRNSYGEEEQLGKNGAAGVTESPSFSHSFPSLRAQFFLSHDGIFVSLFT